MSKITYANKVAINENVEIPNINKITDDDMNEIKTVVNNNDNDMITINTKLANITGQILWTNSAPSGEFASQTISLSSSDYDEIGIYYYDYRVSKGMQYIRAKKGENIRLTTTFWYDSKIYIANRKIDFTTSTSVAIDNATGIETGAITTPVVANDQCIPVYFVGYKTGLFN